jgi:hypothetical protein
LDFGESRLDLLILDDGNQSKGTKPVLKCRAHALHGAAEQRLKHAGFLKKGDAAP